MLCQVKGDVERGIEDYSQVVSQSTLVEPTNSLGHVSRMTEVNGFELHETYYALEKTAAFAF